MNRIVLAMMVTVSLMPRSTAKHTNDGRVVLPNSKLVGCKASDCSQLWQDMPTDGAAIYPHNSSIDIENGAVLGIVAHYEKSLSIGQIKSSIDDHYGKSTYVIDNETSPVKVWKYEPERIAIQLSEEDDGKKQVIYLSANAWRNWRKPQDAPAAVPDDSH